MAPANESGKIVGEIVSKEHGVTCAEQPRGGPIPPAGKESPEIAVAGAYPAVKTALDGNRCGQLRSGQRNGDAPKQWKDEQINEGHARATGGDHFFEAERSAGGVG